MKRSKDKNKEQMSDGGGRSDVWRVGSGTKGKWEWLSRVSKE